jgi:hypothetical protein
VYFDVMYSGEIMFLMLLCMSVYPHRAGWKVKKIKWCSIRFYCCVTFIHRISKVTTLMFSFVSFSTFFRLTTIESSLSSHWKQNAVWIFLLYNIFNIFWCDWNKVDCVCLECKDQKLFSQLDKNGIYYVVQDASRPCWNQSS